MAAFIPPAKPRFSASPTAWKGMPAGACARAVSRLPSPLAQSTTTISSGRWLEGGDRLEAPWQIGRRVVGHDADRDPVHAVFLRQPARPGPPRKGAREHGEQPGERLPPRRRPPGSAERQRQQSRGDPGDQCRPRRQRPGAAMMLGEVASQVPVIDEEEGAVPQPRHRAPQPVPEAGRRPVAQHEPGALKPLGEVHVLEPGGVEPLVEPADRRQRPPPESERRRRRLLDRRPGRRLGRARWRNRGSAARGARIPKRSAACGAATPPASPPPAPPAGAPAPPRPARRRTPPAGGRAPPRPAPRPDSGSARSPRAPPRCRRWRRRRSRGSSRAPAPAPPPAAAATAAWSRCPPPAARTAGRAATPPPARRGDPRCASGRRRL